MNVQSLLARFWHTDRPLTLVALGSILLLLVCLVGMALDPRMITGMPAWDKPAKFALSVSLYCFTFVWMLGFVQGRGRRLAGWIASLTALGFAVELVIIVMQVLRGTTSHFNLSTPLNATLYSLMGSFVLLIWVMNFAAAVLLAFQRLPDRLLAFSLRLGLALTLLGGGVGALMTMPTAAQLQGMSSAAPSVVGAHTVGAPDGGPGLPFLGWSTAHGDLRAPHFVGLHALQLLPLLGALIALTGRRFGWSERQRLALLWTGSGAYLGLLGLLLWQALRGQSVVAPDAQTLTAGLGLALAVGLAVTLTLRTARPRALAAR